jgi:DNA-binding response OmpR family regulator
MTDLDGYQACKMIRAYINKNQLRQPRIIAVTGHAEPSFIKRASTSGMDGLLTKPYGFKVIRPLVDKEVERYNTRPMRRITPEELMRSDSFLLNPSDRDLEMLIIKD